MVPRAPAILGVLLVAATCSPFSAGTSDGGVTDGGGSDGSAVIATDATDASVVDAAVLAPCPATGRGPTMARAGNVCIDSTPVTNGQYEAFLAATDKPTFSGAACTQSAPTDTRKAVACDGVNAGQRAASAANPMMPVICVTACDARVFCAWTGKHLCGGLDGKPQADPDDIGHDRDEWTHACSENGAHALSTGTTWNPSGCIVKESPLPSPQPVDRTPACEGPKGVFDLVSNVVVWIDACTTGSCRGAGESSKWRAPDSIGLGSNANTPGRCDAIDTNPPGRRADDLGFRCCAAPK